MSFRVLQREKMYINQVFRYMGSSSRHRWNQENRLPINPNKSGPLTDLPDYTYMDGKLAPMGANQAKRLLQQRDLAAKIVEYTKEMDFAVERYNEIQREKEDEVKRIVNSKLKQKGHTLLSK